MDDSDYEARCKLIDGIIIRMKYETESPVREKIGSPCIDGGGRQRSKGNIQHFDAKGKVLDEWGYASTLLTR
jgi:hypothetical protein